MSDSIFDDRSKEGDALVEGILQQASALPETEDGFDDAVSNICLDLRSLVIIAMESDKDIVMRWQQALHHLPETIGLHPEFSDQAQQRIDMLRNVITERIDEELPTLGRVPGDDGSGIRIGGVLFGEEHFTR